MDLLTFYARGHYLGLGLVGQWFMGSHLGGLGTDSWLVNARLKKHSGALTKLGGMQFVACFRCSEIGVIMKTK